MTVFGEALDDDEDAQREELRHMDGIDVMRPRKSPPRLPSGTVPLFSAEVGDGCIPVTNGDKPSPWQVLGAFYMQGNLTNRLLQAGALDSLAPTETLEQFDKAFRAAFGCPPQTAIWVDAFIMELERARSAWFGAEQSGVEPGDHERLAVARVALREVREFLGKCPTFCPVLPFWLSVPLTALLLRKFSFGRGGGGALGAGTIRELLINPSKLAAYLRRAKLARFFTVELGLLASESVVHSGTQPVAP